MSTNNYASKFSPILLKAINQGALTRELLQNDVRFDPYNAKTFHFTGMSVSGFKDASARGLGYEVGTYTQTDHPYELEHERSVAIPVHELDRMETSETATVMKVAGRFTQTQYIPEMDAYAFSKIASLAMSIQGTADADGTVYETQTLASWTAANAYSRIVQAIAKAKCKLYRGRQGGLLCYTRSEIMDLLALSSEIQHRMEVDRNKDTGAETRILNINGVKLIEIINQDRFMTSYVYTNGFTPAEDAGEINILMVAPEMNRIVQKYNKIRYFEPGTQLSLGENGAVAFYALWDCFSFPNDISGKYDSFYVSATVESES